MAHAPSGALFTTVADGSEVNANIYASKDLVYLDGGPGPGAPQGAAGLDDDTYVFQVTEPNGRTLLSQDAAKCRQFTVSGGIITAVVVTGCQHVTGVDVDHNADGPAHALRRYAQQRRRVQGMGRPARRFPRRLRRARRSQRPGGRQLRPERRQQPRLHSA